jgi:hypothetical protein
MVAHNELVAAIAGRDTQGDRVIGVGFRTSSQR